ncbi:UNVERIFIED_CONTAM: hypothetical protein OHV15_14355 [Microbacterium sp. SLM126]
MPIINIHQRIFPAGVAEVAALLDQLGTRGDRFWPRDRWPAIKVPRPLRRGDRAGHGPIRYRVSDFGPTELWFEFEPEIGLIGRHGLIVEPTPDGRATVLRHVLEGRSTGRMLLAWPLIFRWLHDQLVEEALDNAGRLLGISPLSDPDAHQWNGPSRWALVVRRAVEIGGRLGADRPSAEAEKVLISRR